MQSEGFLQRGEGKSSCAEPSKTGPELFTGKLQCLHGEQQTALSKSCAETKWHQTLRQPKVAGLFLQR